MVTLASMRAEFTTMPTIPITQAQPPLLPFLPPLPTPLPRMTSPQPLPISPAHTAPATSTHASAWSVTCESIVQRLVNQCLEHWRTGTSACRVPSTL
ncbi:unnamed protein product [Schistocephalus solidus]|uniref:Uncharacterized protein n=1 Tax=Schistocephalus solidus TaxID=70667 RepID=A0A3P7F2T4_SCHSO|nr:unnamed protein product [Schistocephalus solidus]